MSTTKIISILMCLVLAGCICHLRANRTVELEKRVVQLQESLSTKEEEMLRKKEAIDDLKNLLVEKDKQLKDQELKIEELRKQLEMFGVFEK